MKSTINDTLRRLQKEGEYHFEGLTREESRAEAAKLAKKAIAYDKKWDIKAGSFGIARDGFGYYYTIAIATNR